MAPNNILNNSLFFQIMLEALPSQATHSTHALHKIRSGVISVLVNPWLRGRVQLLPQKLPSFTQEIKELNFAILYDEPQPEGARVRRANVCFRFNSLSLEDGPVSVELESWEGSTYKYREFFPGMKSVEELDLQKILIDLLLMLNQKGIDKMGDHIKPQKVNLPIVSVPNKNQSFTISRNSSFSRPQPIYECSKLQKVISSRPEIQNKDSNIGSIKGKRNSKPMKKNANLPKFLIRIFIKYLDKFKKNYPRKEFDRLYSDCKKMKEWKRTQNKQHALGLKHLKQLFQEEKTGYPDPIINRKVVMKIISEYLLQEICQNSQIPETHRLGYLVACRVYALRCRNSSLAGRIQSK